MKRIFAVLLPALSGLFMLAASVMPAASAASDWVETEGGRIRLVALPPDGRGRISAIVDIDLKPGWKTYWRDPGASGMAPEIDLDASTNVRLERIRFPVPALHAEGTSSLIGYDRPVRLVLDLVQPVPGAPSVLSGRLLVGICETICIPVMADINLPLQPGTNPDSAEFGAVRMAEAALPDAPTEDFRVLAADVDTDGKTLVIDLAVPDTSIGPAFLTNPEGFTLGPALAGPVEAGRVRLAVPVLRAPEGRSLAGQTLTLVVTAGRRAMETGLVPQ